MQVRNKLFLYIIWPVGFSEQLWARFVHCTEQLVKRIAVAQTGNQDLLDVVHGDLLVKLPLDEVDHLIVLYFRFGICVK